MSNFFTFPLPPFLLFFLAAFAIVFLRGRVASIFALLIPVVSLLNVLQFEHGYYLSYSLMGLEFNMLHVDRLSLIFAYLFHLAAFIGLLFAFHVNDKTQQVAALAYAGSAIGAVFAGDWITLFIFWELLALTSVFLIWARRTERSYNSGMRYLIIQVLSGVLLFAGALLVIYEKGSTNIQALELGNLSSWLIFLALGIKCGFPLMHTWITDSYPEATPTGTVFLSAFTTKVAVYALARTFAGEDILITIGLTMACFPIFYAVIENDLRRVLAYSMINQIGFMVCGIGIGTELALNGTVAHAFNDVLFKGLLMMSMGAVLFRTGNINGSDLGGLYKTMPKTTILCIVGAASISAFPLFSGFVSKSIIMAEMLRHGHTIGWLLLLFAAAGVFHHAGIKIPFFAFFAHDSGRRVKEAPWNMLLAMSMGACACIIIGSFPSHTLYKLLPYAMDYSPYDLTHVLTQLQILFFSALAFVFLNLWKLYPPELRSTNIDSDWLYRKLAYGILTKLSAIVALLYEGIIKAAVSMLNIKLKGLEKVCQPQGLLARAWGLNNMLLIMLALMIVIFLFDYKLFN